MTSSVDGLVSGLDTTQIISSLMAVERQSQSRLKLAKTADEAVVTAYQSLNTRFEALRSAADALTTEASWQVFKATSSAPAAVSAQATAGAAPGVLSFTVDDLAVAHSLISSSSVADPFAIVASGPITLTKNDGSDPVVVAVGSGSLTDVAAAINASSAGVTAAILRVGPTEYRLQLTSTTTSTAGAITIDPASLGPLGTFDTLAAAQDAQITIGSGPAAVVVTSGSNTISDLVPGLTLTLAQTSASPVTVTVAADGAALADRVGTMVSAANALLAEIKTATAYNPDTRQAGLLLGDSAVRRLHDQLVDSITSAVAGSALGNASAAGVSFQRDGTVSFDRDKFLTAYSADPTGVASLFRQGATSSVAGITLRTAGPAVAAGDHEVVVTTAAERADAVGAELLGETITADETITVTVEGQSITYAATAGESLSSIAAGLTAESSASALGVVATVEDHRLVLRSTGYGAAAAFTVRSSTAAAGQTGVVSVADTDEAHTGVDVAGTIDGVAATGLGQMLNADPATPGGAGLSLLVTLTPAEVAAPVSATFTYQPGLAARLSAAAFTATDTTTGILTAAIASRRSHMADLDTQIEKWDVRLEMRETALRRQFAALESVLGTLRSQGNWLSSQIAQLPTPGQAG